MNARDRNVGVWGLLVGWLVGFCSFKFFKKVNFLMVSILLDLLKTG